MPIFEYVCKACDHQFEALVYGKEKAECPKCHSHKLAPQLSVFAVTVTQRAVQLRVVWWRLRLLWRPARTRVLLTAGHELSIPLSVWISPA